MRKTVFHLMLCAMLFALSYSALAQQPKKVSRIGYLSASRSSWCVRPSQEEAIRLALRERGQIEGREHRHRVADTRPEGHESIGARSVLARAAASQGRVSIVVAADGDVLIRSAAGQY